MGGIVGVLPHNLWCWCLSDIQTDEINEDLKSNEDFQGTSKTTPGMIENNKLKHKAELYSPPKRRSKNHPLRMPQM